MVLVEPPDRLLVIIEKLSEREDHGAHHIERALRTVRLSWVMRHVYS